MNYKNKSLVRSYGYDTYWKFASKRQEAFYNKVEGLDVLTDDAVIKEYKFTNTYRFLDRVSQYLIRNVIYQEGYSSRDTVFRILFFKLFNKIETWEYVSSRVGSICIENYDFKTWNSILSDSRSAGKPIYSNAYMMASGSRKFDVSNKHTAHLMLLEMMLKQGMPERITDSECMKEVFDILRSYPLIGDFLAYQYATDINYSDLVDFSEHEFTCPGPGAKDGIKKCFESHVGYKGADIIQYMYEQQDYEFERLGLEFKKIGGRSLQLIDIQNIFCEFDKYCRIVHPELKGVSNRVRIKQKFKENRSEIDYFFPPKWNIEFKV